ncbi:hypothetical protein LINGRAHAP2_LOCUS36738 [Linum grandiflorum]
MTAKGHSLQLGIAAEMNANTDISYWEAYDREGHRRMRAIID